jgi:hypothetical protein
VSKPVKVTHDVAVTVEQAYAVLSTERWPLALAAALGDDARVERQESLDGSLLLSHSHQLPDGAPGIVAKVLPKDGRVLQTDRWEIAASGAERRGTWEVTFPGAPGKATGSYLLSPSGSGCTWAVQGTVSLPIPLIGGKIESYVVEMLGKLLARQAGVLQDAAAGLTPEA